MQSDRIKGRFMHSGVLVVPVRVNDLDLQFLVDTGAAFCALRKKIASYMGIKFDSSKTVSVLPAGKESILASYSSLEKFRIGGVDTHDLSILLLDLPAQLKVDGILGMNFLRKFRFCIEPDASTLILRKL